MLESDGSDTIVNFFEDGDSVKEIAGSIEGALGCLPPAPGLGTEIPEMMRNWIKARIDYKHMLGKSDPRSDAIHDAVVILTKSRESERKFLWGSVRLI